MAYGAYTLFGASGREAIGNPWFDIWTNPRNTIRRVVNFDPRYRVRFIAGLAGAMSALETRWSHMPASGAVLWPLWVVISVVLGAILSIVGLYIEGVLLKWVGAALGGVASYTEVRAALAWAEVPVILAFVVGLISILLGSGGPVLPYMKNPGNSFGVSTLHAVLAIWSFVLMLKCLAEVHRFSAWRALGSIALLVLISMLIIGVSISFSGHGAMIFPHGVGV